MLLPDRRLRLGAKTDTEASNTNERVILRSIVSSVREVELPKAAYRSKQKNPVSGLSC